LQTPEERGYNPPCGQVSSSSAVSCNVDAKILVRNPNVHNATSRSGLEKNLDRIETRTHDFTFTTGFRINGKKLKKIERQLCAVCVDTLEKKNECGTLGQNLATKKRFAKIEANEKASWTIRINSRPDSWETRYGTSWVGTR
ncbi:hypothetical protein L9F63_008572, partial [Diploptera punctata]